MGRGKLLADKIGDRIDSETQLFVYHIQRRIMFGPFSPIIIFMNDLFFTHFKTFILNFPQFPSFQHLNIVFLTI